MPSVLKARESSAVTVAVECRPANETSCRTNLQRISTRYTSETHCAGNLPMLGEVPDERSKGLLIESLAHPIEGRAQVVD